MKSNMSSTSRAALLAAVLATTTGCGSAQVQTNAPKKTASMALQNQSPSPDNQPPHSGSQAPQADQLPKLGPLDKPASFFLWNLMTVDWVRIHQVCAGSSDPTLCATTAERNSVLVDLVSGEEGLMQATLAIVDPDAMNCRLTKPGDEKSAICTVAQSHPDDISEAMVVSNAFFTGQEKGIRMMFCNPSQDIHITCPTGQHLSSRSLLDGGVVISAGFGVSTTQEGSGKTQHEQAVGCSTQETPPQYLKYLGTLTPDALTVSCEPKSNAQRRANQVR